MVLGQQQDAGVRRLGPADLAEVRALLGREPALDVFVASRVDGSKLVPARLGGDLWGYHEQGRLTSLCYSGANLVPAIATAEALHAFARTARAQGRVCSSIVGRASDVEQMWSLLRPWWGAERELRAMQPVLAMSADPLVASDPLVRPVMPAELEILLPACIAMFTEEVGVSPIGPDGGASYRSRVAELIRNGRALARIEHGQVIFKAEIGAVSRHACQVQGVWVDPQHRGKQLASAGTAAVVRYALSHVAPVVQLYVNDFNIRARRAYAAVGFHQVGTFASVLF